MTKNKVKPNSKKIRDIQNRFQLTVRQIGELFKDHNIDLSERTYSSIISGTETSPKQLSKILDLFEIIANKKKQKLGLKTNDLISKHTGPKEYDLFCDLVTNETLGRLFDGRDQFFRDWDQINKIFRYLIKLDSSTAKLISGFIDSLDSFAFRTHNKFTNYVEKSWYRNEIKNDVSIEKGYLNSLAALSDSVEKLKEVNVKIFFIAIDKIEIRPNFQLLQDLSDPKGLFSGEVSPIAWKVTYFNFIFAPADYEALVCKIKEPYQLEFLNDFIENKITAQNYKKRTVSKCKMNVVQQEIKKFFYEDKIYNISTDKSDFYVEYNSRNLEQIKKYFIDEVKNDEKHYSEKYKSFKNKISQIANNAISEIKNVSEMPHVNIAFEFKIHFLDPIHQLLYESEN